ncbi:Inactive serine/threonine-protein kinase TEX14, partial [Chaetura pelagica]
GVFVDAVNSMGQTCLFTAALLGLAKIVDVLLQYGSEANHRCHDGSTPVHAAAFSGNKWILSKLLDEGGDLRVHDKDGRSPEDWAMSAGKASRAQMLEFLQCCTSHMQAAIQNCPSELLRRVGSSKALVCSQSRFGGLVQVNADSPLGRFLKGGANAAKNIYNFGFGKLYLAGCGRLGYLASLPVIGEKDVVQAYDEPTFSYCVGPYMMMTNLMWGGSRVTVKELSFEPHQKCRKQRLADLLIAEQEHSSKLHHPHLLLLMSVCLSSDLKKTRLVYERVNFGSLYSILHERRTEFSLLHIETILHVLLQISEALHFLHSRGFIHRSLTSYAIQIVSSGVAKLCNLEYMVESKDGGEQSDLTRIPVPVQLYRWCSPEVILGRIVTVKSDIYSFCAVVQEALTETPPWKDVEDTLIKELIISGQQLEADIGLPVPYYDTLKAGLEPKQRNPSVKLQDIQYILKNDLKDLATSPAGHADEVSKAERALVSPDVNSCLASAFSYNKRTQEFQGKEITEAGISSCPRYSAFCEKSPFVDQEASTNLRPVAQDKNDGAASDLQMTLSDVDDSLCSFEVNEIFASYPELEDFLEEAAGLGQTQKDENKRQQKEEDKATLREVYPSSGVQCEEKPGDEEGGFSEWSTEYTTEEEERASEASDLCVLTQGRVDSGRRMSGVSRSEQYIGKCVLDLKIMQSMVQQAADSLHRTLHQEIRRNLLSEQMLKERYRTDYTSQNTSNPFPGVNRLFWKAVGPPSSDYILPLLRCQAQGALGGDSVQAISEMAKEMEVIKSEKWKCFPEMSKTKSGKKHHDFSLVMTRMPDVLNHGLLDSFQHLLPHVSVRCKKKINLQCQRGGDSHSATSGSEEERWCYPNPRPEVYSRKISEERRMMQPEWWTEVKQMARRAALGQLGLDSPCPASEYTSESEAESIKEAFQHVTVRVPKSQDQQSYRWQTGDNMVPWDLGSEDGCESEESDLESTFRSSGGRSCQSPSQDEQAESGIAIYKNSDLPQQVENLPQGHSRELHSSLNSSPGVSEEFLTPDYFLPPTTQGHSELEVKIREKTGMNVGVSAAFTVCQHGTLFPSTGEAELPVSEVNSNVQVAQKVIQWEPQEERKEDDVSVTDIQDLSSIPCEQENYYRVMGFGTPRVSHAPASVSTPLSSELKIQATFEKYKHFHEVSSNSSSFHGGSQETSSAESSTFTTASEEGRRTEIPLVPSRTCSPELDDPVILLFTSLCFILFHLTQGGLPVVASSLRSTKKAAALSEASDHFIEELPPPAQELLDEIEYLKQQESFAQEKGLHDCGMQINVPDQMKMEDRESEQESERNETRNHSLWTNESFTLAEVTERAHSTLDASLERMIRAIPGDEKIQEQ